MFTLICKQIKPHFLIKPDYNKVLGYEAHLNLKERHTSSTINIVQILQT